MGKNEEGLTWDEASPDLRNIVAENQLWAEKVGYASVGNPSHGALRMKYGGGYEKDSWSHAFKEKVSR